MNRLEFLVMDPAVRKVSPSCSRLRNMGKTIVFPKKGARNKLRSSSRKKVYRPGSLILEKRSPSSVMCFNSWKSFRTPVDVQVQSGFGAFFKCDT